MFDIFPLKEGIANVEGFYCDGINAGLKPNDAPDVAYIRSDFPCDVEAVFTTNTFQAAPIKHYKRYGKNFKTNFLLMNSKNANAMTGKEGINDIDDIFNKLKKTLKNLTNPIMSSTGVIGCRLPKNKITSSFEKFDFSSKNSESAAKAIMTTDGFKKEIALKVELENGKSFNIASITKGAGMINPAMATMLCFIVTDAKVPKDDMKELLKENVEYTFNAISVDGDTSTNDTVMLLANGASEAYEKEAFKTALEMVMKEMSMLILKDGEGAGKLVAFEVKDAKSKEDALKASKALSNSPLVKTALFGEDPNWGRIASTIGASGIECDEEELTIKYDNVTVYSKEQKELDAQTESKAHEVMKKDSYKVVCNLNMGDFSYTSYGCDLSYEYVKINAEYRT